MPVELALIILGRENLHAAGRIREGMFCEEPNGKARKEMLRGLLAACLGVRSKDAYRRSCSCNVEMCAIHEGGIHLRGACPVRLPKDLGAVKVHELHKCDYNLVVRTYGV